MIKIVVIVVLLLFVSGVSAAAKAVNGLRFGEVLTKPNVEFNSGQYGAVDSVMKISGGDILVPWSRYQYLFFTAPAEEFKALIPVYDGLKEIKVYDGDTADCSFEKTLLAKNNNEIYLFTATKINSADFTVSQAKPARQDIKIFKLVHNDENNQDKMTFEFYFKKIEEQKTSKTACTSDEVYELIKQTASRINLK